MAIEINYELFIDRRLTFNDHVILQRAGFSPGMKLISDMNLDAEYLGKFINAIGGSDTYFLRMPTSLFDPENGTDDDVSLKFEDELQVFNSEKFERFIFSGESRKKWSSAIRTTNQDDYEDV